MPGQNLHPHRQTFRGISARYAHARNSRQAPGNRINVREVHGQRVVHLLAELEGGEGRDRGHNGIHLLKRIRKIARDQGAHFLRFQVVRIIVSRTQHISAQHDAALTLGSEPLAACVAIHIGERVAGRRAESVSNAIVAGQIGAGLGGRDDVITGDGVVGGRQADLADLAAERFELRPRLWRSGRRFRWSNAFRYSRGSPSFKPFTLPVSVRSIVRHGRFGRCGIARIAPGDHATGRWPHP